MELNDAVAITADKVSKSAIIENGRRSLTCPDEVEVDVDLEQNRSRKRSIDFATSSERGELMSASFFEEEEGVIGNEMGQRKWEDFMEMQENEHRQPEQHDEAKSVCMKLFPTLSKRTNLTEDELKVYYSIRFTYIHPYNERT